MTLTLCKQSCGVIIGGGAGAAGYFYIDSDKVEFDVEMKILFIFLGYLCNFSSFFPRFLVLSSFSFSLFNSKPQGSLHACEKIATSTWMLGDVGGLSLGDLDLTHTLIGGGSGLGSSIRGN